MNITPSTMTGGAPSPTSPQSENKQTDMGSDAVTPIPSTPSAPASDPLSPRLAALAQREQMMRMQAKQLKAERAAIEAARAESKSEIESARSWKERLPEDTWGVLSEAGLTPEQISERVFSPEALEKYKFQKFQTDLEKRMQAKFDDLKTSQESQIAAQMEQARTQFRRETSQLVKNNPGEFEAIQAHGEEAEQAVVDLIEATFNQDGYVMDVDKAALEVEEYLVQKSMELAKLKKVQSRLSPPTAPEAPEAQKLQPSQNTLSNRNIPSTTKPLSDRERRERAILAVQGKL